MGGLTTHRRNSALAFGLAGAVLVASGCGGGMRQDQAEVAGNYPVRVVSATFPEDQRLAKDSTMEIVVENAGQERIPNINVSVKCPGQGLGGSFLTDIDNRSADDPRRPQFVVDKIPTRGARVNPPLDPAPLERSSALVETYPLGPLEPGKTGTFRWKVSSVRAGPYRLCWRVNAGLYGKAKAIASEDSELPISGEFKGSVSDRAPQARVAGDTKTVITEDEQ